MAVQLDPQLMDILACPAEDHGPLRAGAGRGRPRLHRVRTSLPGGRRHPRAAARPRDPMTGLDDTLLGDARALAALDTGGVLRSAATAGAQVRSTAHAAQEAKRRGRSPGTAPARWCCCAGRARPRPRSSCSPRCSGRCARCRSCCPTPCRAGSARWTSWSRTPPTPPTVISPSPSAGPWPVARRSCCRRPATGRSRPRGRAGCGWWSRASRCPPGLDLPRALAVGLTTVAALDLLPTPCLRGPGRARRHPRRRGRAQRPRQRGVHEPGQVARAAAGRAHAAAVGHRPARRGRRRARRRGAGHARRGRGARGRHRAGRHRHRARAPARGAPSATSSTTRSPTSPRPRPRRRGSC